MIEQALLVGLAAWRVASLLVEESGPFEVFSRIRRLAGADAEGALSGVGSLLSCVWCVSVWSALALWGVWEVWRPEPVVVIAAMAFPPMIERWVRGAS